MTKLLLLLAISTAACTTSPDTTATSRRAIINTPCAADTDCPTGFACEIEVEHGTTTSFCQAVEPSDDTSVNGNCPAGYELEVENGQNFCEPDGSGGGGGSGDAGTTDDPPSTGTGIVGATCATSADCATGLECELSTLTCKAHGGH